MTPFLLATAIGKLPLITLYTVAGNQVDIYTWQSILALLIYTFVLLVLANFVQKKSSWKQFGEDRQERSTSKFILELIDCGGP